MLLPEPRPTRWDLHWRMFGSEVRIRPVFWASCVLLGVIVYRDPEIGGMAMFWFWIAAVSISLLAHGTSHILAARLMGGRIRVVLSGLGGQVFGLEERKRWQRVLILLAGSLGNLLLAGILWAVADPHWNPLPIDRLGREWTQFIANAVEKAWLLNVFWALLNVLPLWPLDGGRIAVDLGEALLGRRGRIAALLASLVVCLLLSLFVAAWARLNLTNRFDSRYSLHLLFFCIQFLYCYFLWLSAFGALWGDPVPLDKPSKSQLTRSVSEGHPRLRFGLVVICCSLGCGGEVSQPELVWGKRGVQNGDMVRPRAIAIDDRDRLYIVDFTARVQVYDRDGRYLGPTWTTPDYRNGRPSGLSIDRDGNLLVSDSHYNCFRIYSPDGVELRRFGGQGGNAPGQLGYVSDVVQDEDRNYYVAEFGENQRISKFDRDGKFLSCWGSAGSEPGQFSRARALALGPDGNLYVADACNDRIQVFSRDGALLRCWGVSGAEPGQLKYPYDLAFSKDGVLYVVEFGNNRVQKFTVEGEPLGCWGGPGHAPGQLHNPWALAIDSRGKVHVIDTENHRVQRIDF